MAVITQYDAPYHQLIEEQRAYYSTGITAKLEHRRKQLLKLKRLLTEETDVLTKAVYNDLRRSPKLTHSLELSAVLVEIDYMLDNLEQWSSPEPEPLGVVLIIAPWNYPLSLVLLPLVAAVAAGQKLQQFLAVVNGGIVQTTDLLKEKFDHILYTGNSLIAKVIMTAAAQHLTPVTLELGGKSPVIVESDIDLEISSRRIVWGKWTNCGQTCIAPDYVLVTETLKTVLFLLFAIIFTIHLFFSRLCGLLSRSKGQILYKGGELNRNDLFIPPIIISVSADDALMKDELYSIKRKTTCNLSFTRSERKVRQLYAETSSGSVTVNDVMFQFLIDTLPFGGVGQSGMGKYRGKFGFDTFSNLKALLIRGFLRLVVNYILKYNFSMRYPPFTDRKFRHLKLIMERRRPLPSSLPNWLIRILFLLAGVVSGVVLQDRAINDAEDYDIDIISQYGVTLVRTFLPTYVYRTSAIRYSARDESSALGF
ncbi:Aldehyde dehydrogenase [Dirofilaria immitis]|nr:Aldehyde dehydrogenase [Dirofilaria immitis]